MLSDMLGTSAATTTVSGFTMLAAFLYAAAAGGFGLLISFSYLKTGKVSKNFARTLIVLPVMVSVVMTMVNGNLGTSVAIMGAFGLIRFRSLQGSSRDIGYVFFAMTVGVICSMGYLLFALGITIFLDAVLLLLYAVHFGENKQQLKDLRVTIPENLDYTDIFDDLFKQYTREHKLLQVKTTNMGSLYELEYHISLQEEAKEKEFLDALRCRNGNLTVICGRTDFGEEEL